MRAAEACWTGAILIVTLLTARDMCRGHELLVSANYTALGGDLTVAVSGLAPDGLGRNYHLELSRQSSAAADYVAIGSVPVTTLGDNATVGVFPCGLVALGGRYMVKLVPSVRTKLGGKVVVKGEQDVESETVKAEDGRIKRSSDVLELDVRWPQAVLTLGPPVIHTYPEVAVTATLGFPSPVCRSGAEPELWLELVHCGASTIGCVNNTRRQVLYSEQVRGYPGRRVVSLKCELFGLPGHYALNLRSAVPTTLPVLDADHVIPDLKAVWSDKFVFNVHARSIFPCDGFGGGITVLFQYPACILDTGDRVRLFARLRADVASLIPPTSLHYVAEQKVNRGKHSLHFDCELFSERFVEYCFVYVNQAITGAVSDVRMDCVPTMPVSEADSGGWGGWSPWTACTTSCGGGTRNRYRFCDSPPPRYGAKFCEGTSLETEHCGSASGDWDCLYSETPRINSAELPSDRPDVKAEVGPMCRCGCIVHLGSVKPRRLVATSSQSCPGRTFWLIQADEGHVIRFSMQHVRLPCDSQWLKVRDGDSLSAILIAQLTGGNHVTSSAVTSSGSFLLLEFFTDEVFASGVECGGGFLAQAQQILPTPTNLTAMSPEDPVVLAAPPPLTLVHWWTAVFVCGVLVLSACLGAQYCSRYRKYQLAADAADMETLTGSQYSLVLPRSRAASNSTLLSEVISLRRFNRPRHCRLQEEDEEVEEHYESADSEHEYEVIPSPVRTTAAGSSPAGSHRETLRRSTTLTATKTSCTPSGADTASVSHAGTGGSVTEESASDVGSVTGHRLSSSRTLSIGASTSTLTNGCSPVPSLRGTNPKESKDKRNLERLLAGSEFSLAGQDTDLELDYYDYNVSNAGAVPGSYLGMDPAYLVWIPPFAPGCWEEDEVLGLPDKEQNMSQLELREYTTRTNHYNNGLLQDFDKDREQNSGDIEMEDITDKTGQIRKITDNSYKRQDNGKICQSDNVSVGECRKYIRNISRNSDEETKDNDFVSEHDGGTLKRRKSLAKVGEQLLPPVRDQQPKAPKVCESPARVHYRPSEKETRVEKSPSAENEYYDIIDADVEADDDIKFADEEDDEDHVNSSDSVVAESNKTHHIRA